MVARSLLEGVSEREQVRLAEQFAGEGDRPRLLVLAPVALSERNDDGWMAGEIREHEVVAFDIRIDLRERLVHLLLDERPHAVGPQIIDRRDEAAGAEGRGPAAQTLAHARQCDIVKRG